MGYARFPRVDPDVPSKPPLGGFNLAVSAYSENKDVDFEAAACLGRQAEPADRGRTRRPPPLPLRPLHATKS